MILRKVINTSNGPVSLHLHNYNRVELSPGGSYNLGELTESECDYYRALKCIGIHLEKIEVKEEVEFDESDKESKGPKPLDESVITKVEDDSKEILEGDLEDNPEDSKEDNLEEPKEENLEELSKAEIKKLLSERGIEYTDKDTKPQLISKYKDGGK